MADSSEFLFITCQVGAEATLKRELAKYRPAFRFAYSRPGFLTFKLPADHGLADDFDLKSIFARSYGFSLGKVDGSAELGARSAERSDASGSEPSPPITPASPFVPSPAMVADVWRLAAGRAFTALHVWPRDLHAPGDHDFEVGQNDASRAVEAMLRGTTPPEFAPLATKRPTESGDLVLDVVLLDANRWWVGYHRASTLVTRRAGGIFDEIELPYEAVSRAWLKMEEALRWSNLPVRRGDIACEIGCAPGGSCQALLQRGLKVLGVDPAEMHPAVFDHPNFRHLRMRGAEMKRRELRGVRWLMTDMNVAPNYTLDTVEALVTHDDVEVEGMLLTLKLLDWKQADAAEDYRARVQSWGFSKIRMRQLQNNRREFCLFALKSRSES
jgi:23S rRNA (cytidine2498-2'-O)-methyltransferase